MTTALDVVKGALKDIGVLAAGESPTADDSTDVLEKLNQMVASWELEGLPMYGTAWTSATTVPLPDNHILAIRYSLAVHIAPMFEKQVSSIVVQGAQDGYLALQSAYGDPIEMDIDTALTPRSRYPSGRYV